jgi:lipopolysaccharide/colanic/teichoic acid biosynthesis glycosyltransferase
MGICACIFIALLPLFILVPILIKITSKGPVFFRQERVGYHGRIFKVIKFRTMSEDADSKKVELMDQNEQSGPVFKITNDPRITPLGNILRKYSIDELPQIFNVFSGDMGLVGPRPAIIDEVKEYKPEWRRRLSMKPGITGLWQVSGRNNIKDFDEWVKLDVEYIDNWSFWLDLKIILKTIPAIIIGTGK